MLGTLRPDVLFLLNHRAGRCEVFVYLAVEVFAVGDDEERPVAGDLPQHLLRKEDHGETLARTLRVPEDANLSLVLLYLLYGIQSTVHAEELMVLRYQLRGLPLPLAEYREVLHEVEQPCFVAHTPDDGLQTNHALFAFIVYLLPLGEVLPPGSDAANFALRPVREDDGGVVPEELRNRALVIGEVVLVGVLKSLVGSLQFNEEHRNAIHEAQQVNTLLAIVA